MNRRWSDEAMEFGTSVHSTLSRLGGVELARRAELDPAVRDAELLPALEAIGFGDVDVFGEPIDAEVAAAAARAAGVSVMPWPVAARFAIPRGERESVDEVYTSLGREPRRLEHLDLSARPALVDLRTLGGCRLVATGPVRNMPLDPFGVDCVAERVPELGISDLRRTVDAHIVLSAFYVLGALDTVTSLSAAYASERVQFGQPIVRFGAIQWRLSDIVLARSGLSELATYTLSRFIERTITPADAAALRYTMLDSAGVILANAHQVFGAIGLCEEHDLTVIDRHLQPILRRPAGIAATSLLLRDEIAAHGFDGVFSVPPTGAFAGSLP